MRKSTPGAAVRFHPEEPWACSRRAFGIRERPHRAAKMNYRDRVNLSSVAAMLRLKACGWGIKRIARELGCSHQRVKHYVAAGGVVPFSVPRRLKMLDGEED